jgi:hypothetical protein
MTNPFDYVNSITLGKNNMMRDTENDVLAEKEYNPWIVNKALSYFPDTVLMANDMNMYHDLDKRPQYEYLLNMIRRNKRWAKWVKDEGSEDLDLVIKAYNCNPTVAREYLKLLTKEQLDAIRASMAVGGSK